MRAMLYCSVFCCEKETAVTLTISKHIHKEQIWRTVCSLRNVISLRVLISLNVTVATSAIRWVCGKPEVGQQPQSVSSECCPQPEGLGGGPQGTHAEMRQLYCTWLQLVRCYSLCLQRCELSAVTMMRTTWLAHRPTPDTVQLSLSEIKR
jgi:hypothetical protein